MDYLLERKYEFLTNEKFISEKAAKDQLYIRYSTIYGAHVIEYQKSWYIVRDKH